MIARMCMGWTRMFADVLHVTHHLLPTRTSQCCAAQRSSGLKTTTLSSSYATSVRRAPGLLAQMSQKRHALTLPSVLYETPLARAVPIVVSGRRKQTGRRPSAAAAAAGEGQKVEVVLTADAAAARTSKRAAVATATVTDPRGSFPFPGLPAALSCLYVGAV